MPTQTKPMATFEFALVIEGADILTRESLDALFEAGCDDATFGAVDGAQYGDFSRRAPSLEAAIPGAIDQVEKAIPGARVIRVEPDDLVTAAEIGQRLGRTRESIRLLISGRRGPGGFPPPSSHLKARGRLWRWAEVDGWAKEAIGWTGRSKDAAFIAAINAALELRRLAPRLEEASQRRAIAGILSMAPEDRRQRVRSVLGNYVFNPWDRDPSPEEAETLIADGLTRESFDNGT